MIEDERSNFIGSGETKEIYRELKQNEAMLEASVLGQGEESWQCKYGAEFTMLREH